MEKELTKQRKICYVSGFRLALSGNRDSSFGIVIRQGIGTSRDSNSVRHRSKQFILP